MPSPFEEIASSSAADTSLEFLTNDGSVALYSTHTDLILSESLSERWIEIGADGKVEIVSVEPGRIAEQLDLSGGCKVRICFDPPLTPGTHKFEIKAKFSNSFIQRDEFFTLTFKHPIEHIRFRIIFPENVPVTSASVVRFDPSPKPPAVQVQEAPPSLTLKENSRYEINWIKDNPKVSSVYRIAWSWHLKRV
jgi:hypothetical protein